MTPFVKNGLIILGLLVVGGLGYYLFVMQSDSALTTDTARVNEAQLAGQQFLSELREIRTYNLSNSLFSDERFRSFVDFTLPVSEQPVGRDNPFAPI